MAIEDNRLGDQAMAIEDNRSGDQAIPERFFAETSIALRSGKSKAIKLAESARKPAERPA